MLRVRKAANLEAKRSAFPHQVDALQAIKDLPYAAVFHEQGLGKTKIGLDLALFWLTHDIVDSVIIVAKKGLVENWRAEIASDSHLTPRVLGQDRKRQLLRLQQPGAPVYHPLRGGVVGTQTPSPVSANPPRGRPAGRGTQDQEPGGGGQPGAARVGRRIRAASDHDRHASCQPPVRPVVAGAVFSMAAKPWAASSPPSSATWT